MIKPLITTPAMAAKRFAFLTQATTLTISAIGGVRSIASPPRAVKGDLHPGCSKTISAIATGAISDKASPIRPEFGCGGFSRGGIGWSAFMPKSFHIYRVASMRG